MRRRSGMPLAVLAFSLAVLAKDAPAPVAPEEVVEDRVSVEKQSGVTAVRATIAGEVLALAVPRSGGGRRDVVLLVAPPEPKQQAGDAPSTPAVPCDAISAAGAVVDSGPRRLVRLDPSGSGTLTTLREDLPADARELVPADLDGDGIDELLLVRPTGVSAIRDDGGRRFSGAPASIVEMPEGGLDALLPGVIGTGFGKPALLSIATLGSLRVYGSGSDGAYGQRFTVDLPLIAQRENHGLALSSPAARKLDVGAGVDVIVVDPEPRGSERLRSFVIRPEAPEAERRQEAWSKLPAAEKVLESSFLLLDGRPALALTTIPAGKLSFFGEKLLRVFFLEADRTRAGKPPVAALQTHANLWQAVHIVPADVNGDGKQDLVVGYWKGLKDDTLTLDVYPRRPDGTFERSPRSTSFDVKEADRGILRYGDDLDGRGLGDLLLVSGGSLALYPGGDAASQGRKLVSLKPLWSVPLPGFVQAAAIMSISLGSEGSEIRGVNHSNLDPVVVDLDGDGRAEIVVTGGSGVPGHVLAILPSR